MNDANLKKEERIQRYLGKEMTNEEEIAFRQELEEDEELKILLNDFKNISLVLQKEELFALKQQVKESIEGVDIQPDFQALEKFTNLDKTSSSGGLTSGNTLMNWLLGIAMAGILGAGAYYFTFIDTNAPSLQYEAYLSPPMEVLFVLDDDDPLYPGMKAYEDGLYSKATQLLATELAQRPDEFAQLYLGISYLMDGQLDKAEPALKAAQQIDLTDEPATWYLALTLLELNREKEAEEILSQLTINSSIYAEKAKELLSTLNN